MFKSSIYKLIISVVTIVVATIVAIFGYIDDKLWLTFIMALIIVRATFFIVSLNHQNTRKLAFMFNSMDNGDFLFNFNDKEGSSYDNMLNSSLNRIRDMLRKAREEIREKERFYELIINSVTTGIMVIDKNNNICQANENAHKLLGLQTLTHLSQLDRVEEGMSAKFSNLEIGKTANISYNTERNTINLALDTSATTINGEAMRIIAFNDIAGELDEKELESWIRLTRVLTHEIMNSITPITSLSDTLISMHGTNNDEIGSGLETISSTGKGLISFVESYRKFTRVPSPELKLFYVNGLFERMSSLIQAEYPSRKLAIEATASNELILYADENLVSQIIINLMRNGVQAVDSTKKAIITLRGFCDDNENVIIEVGDNGDIIPADIAEHIFVPFFTTKEGGSGIGLSLSRQIMRVHGGSIRLRNKPRDKCFVLTFR